MAQEFQDFTSPGMADTLPNGLPPFDVQPTSDWAPCPCGGTATLRLTRRWLPAKRLHDAAIPSAISLYWLWLRSAPGQRLRCCDRLPATTPAAQLQVAIHLPHWPAIETDATVGGFVRLRTADWLWVRLYPEGVAADRILAYIAYGRHQVPRQPTGAEIPGARRIR